MKRFTTLFAIAIMAFAGDAYAQVSVDEVPAVDHKREFDNEMKSKEVEADYFSEANYRAERRAIRKERNLVDFSANLHGSLTAYSKSWQASGDNAITILANINFLHTFKKGRFTLTNSASAKFGYNNMKTDLGADYGGTRGVWFKNVDEVVLATAPQWAMVKNWTYGANVKFRTQFAPGYEARGDKQKGGSRVSNFMTPGYFDASVGFTYVLPSEKFPLKVNLAPIAMSATYRHDLSTSKDYGVTVGRSKYEGGLSVQLDFDKTWGKNGWLRYRTTAYSFYGWITDISSKAKFKPTEDKAKYEHVVPTIRWENTIDIKATKYISTQIYFQLYYNKQEWHQLQVSSMLSVGLTYTFKNK
ncbi:MAG: DUF3078 domain-containing protein [Alistipes sp.]|nr:DUF3078 domain-containing protein [Alistipes sp.]MBQ3248954.1 DUF3078 domain-containing protein [Alistipes sp.]